MMSDDDDIGAGSAVHAHQMFTYSKAHSKAHTVV